MESSDVTTVTSIAKNCAHQLLENLLDNVFSTRDCDIATKGRRLSEGITDSNLKNERHVPLDAISLVRESGSSDKNVLVELTLRDAHTNLLQLRCVEQKASGYCGHYALHNVLCMIEMHNSETDEEALQFIEETSSIGAFWRRYWWSVAQLSARASIEDSWPWTEAYVATGDMERSFLRHLLLTDPHINHLGNGNKIIVLQYAYGFIQNSFEEVCEIQSKVDAFRSCPGSTHISFILGVTNHWLGVTVYKTGNPCPCATDHTHCSGCGVPSNCRIDMIILDSNNNTNISASNKQIIERIDKSEKENIAKKGKRYDDWMRSMYVQSHMDQRDILLKIARCVAGKLDLRHEQAENYTKKVLTSYTTSVDTPLQTFTPDYYIPLLISWMDNSYPPQILRDGLIPLISSSFNCLSHETHHQLINWVESNSSRLVGVSLQGLPSVQMFASIIDHIKTKLTF